MFKEQRLSGKIGIFGAGGFGRETLTCIIDCCKTIGRDYKDFAFFITDDQYYSTSEIMGVKVVRASEFDVNTTEVVVAIGDPAIRQKIVSNLPVGTRYGSVIHPTAVISD
jgi:hypothetical protein